MYFPTFEVKMNSHFKDLYIKVPLISKAEEAFITTTDKPTEINGSLDVSGFNLLENVQIKSIKTIKRTRNIMEYDLTLTDMISKKVKFEFPTEKCTIIPKKESELISKEIYLPRKLIQNKKNKLNDKWTYEEMENLFKGLEIWGTDFSMISLMIPTKTHTQIKKKFCNEDKKGNDRINISLNAKKTVKNGNISKELEDLNKIVCGETSVKDFPVFLKDGFPFKENKFIHKKLKEIIESERDIFTHKQEYNKFFITQEL